MFCDKQGGPASAHAVSTMRFLYRILALQPWSLDRLPNWNYCALAKAASRVLASNKLSCRGHVYMSSIYFLGPFWYGNSGKQRGRGRKEKIMEWYRLQLLFMTESGDSVWKSERIDSLEKFLGAFEDRDMKHLKLDPRNWRFTGVRVFMDRFGWAGFLPSDTKAEDSIICFYASDVALVIRGEEKAVIGRALMLKPDFHLYLAGMPYFSTRELKEADTITLSLENWCCVI